MNIGWLLALLVLLAAFVLYLIGKIDPLAAAMFAGLALAILLGGWVVPLKTPGA